MPHILSFGEALIDVFAEKGVPLRAAETLHPSPGGAPANVAVALARRPLIWPDLDTARQWIEEGISTATILKLNDVELEFLTGTSDPERGSDQLLEQGIRLCCVSLGAEGAYYNNGCLKGYIPGFSVEVLNTTGCGDAFTGGLAYGLHSLKESVQDVDEASLCHLIRFANACGALAATKVGAMSGLPTRMEIEHLLETVS